MLITWAATALFDSENSTCNYYDTSGNRITFFLHIVFSGIQVGEKCITCDVSVYSNMHWTLSG